MAYSLLANVAAQSVDTSNVTTAGVDTSGADLLIATVQTSVTAGTAGAMSDSNANTWVLVGQAAVVAGTTPLSWIYACTPTTVGAAHTFTFGAAVSFPAIAVCAFSGGAASQISGTSGTGITSYSPGAIASTPQVTGVAVATLGWNDMLTVSIDSGFTIADQLDHTANALGIAMAYLIAPTGTLTPTWSWSGATTFVVTSLVALFDEPGSGGGSGGGSYAFA